MFYFRLNRLTITDNGSIRPGFGLFGNDFSDVKFLSFVTVDNIDLPDMDLYAQTTDAQQRQTILEAAIKQVVASRVLTEVSRVKDHARLTFGDTGYVLYQSERIPESFNWTFLAIKSNRKLRNAGQITSDILKDEEFGAFASNLTTLVSAAAGAANPAYAAGIAVAKFAAYVIAKNLERGGDQQLGLVYLSLNRAEHYLHGERKSDGVPDLTGNMTCDYSLFGFERAQPVRVP